MTCDCGFGEAPVAVAAVVAAMGALAIGTEGVSAVLDFAGLPLAAASAFLIFFNFFASFLAFLSCHSMLAC